MKSMQLLKCFKTKNQAIRCVSSLQSFMTKPREEVLCNQAVKDAEKIVGYPTSFLSLRWLLNDEVANIALHIRKLIGTNHPLLNTARDLLLKRDVPAWGLIVLLVSKAGGLNKHFSDMECDITAGILHSQRVLAEVTVMIKTSNIVHNSLLNIDNMQSEDVVDLNFGNKIALLSGDYLLSICFRELAGLKNQKVNEIISTSLRDLAEAEFIEPRDKQNRPLPAKPLSVQQDVEIPNEYGTEPFQLTKVLGNTKSEWTLRHILGGGSLLAKCCQGTLQLAGHSDNFQKIGYTLGRNIALAWQTRIDLEIFQEDNLGPFSLISAPVMFHLQHDPSFYSEIISCVDGKVDYENIRRVVKSGPGLSETKKLQSEFCDKAVSILGNFTDSDAKKALFNMIRAM
ncbi:unnamed protein product [Brassicogethes aeneus]|uniref:Decaprenyl-diphosphate synthase subunit 2 n=1 Tax=Brassicogethes aeneus TaxID=1431903 RepID=A0A9P0B8C9_BRAAE|nr:unnamed protein product [Brassicogethes aeneus]